MAGIAAIMTRKKREKRELKSREDSFSDVLDKEAQAAQRKAASENFKKLLMSDNDLTKKSKSLDTLSIQDFFEDERKGFGEPYSFVYLGLVLMAIGLVISFVGLGDKGFKTLELKLIGPCLLLLGFAIVFFKVLQCMFPNVLRLSNYPKKNTNKLGDSANKNTKKRDSSQNGLVKGDSKENNGPSEILSPRVTLQPPSTARKSAPVVRPASSFPNYIDDSSDDDFDPGRSKPHSNRGSLSNQTFIAGMEPQLPRSHSKFDIPLRTTSLPPVHQPRSYENELVLNPKTLQL